MSRLIGGAIPVLKGDGSTSDIPVAAEVTVYTKAFPLRFAQYFGIWVKASSATGTPNIKIELEEGYKLPTTEGSAETTLFVVPTGDSPIFDAINDEIAHIDTVPPTPMTYGRYKITGLTNNPADTIVNIFNFMQEPA